MIDRLRPDADLVGSVQLTGLVPQLTVPSRHHDDLVDIWFGVEWSERNAEWEESFARLAEGWRPDPRHPSYFDLFSHPASSGLIAARQVSPDRGVWQEIEEEARLLVRRVNHDVAERRSPPTVPQDGQGGWTLRVRDASAALLASLRWIGEPRHGLSSVVSDLPIGVSHGSPSGSR
ncbi:MAG TPA: hypothetical protein VL328_06720 [Gemmatimonadaceae bacterium]|jgi:hypothetical protein|nr:hypothetical protein [Gemmatimonadaceae bacterium]